MKRIIALTSLLALGALGMACGGTTVAPNNATNKPAASPAASPATNATPSSSNSTPATTSKAEIGVPACDEYFTKLDEYLSNPKVPEAVKTQYQKSREDNLKAWKAAAATEAGKKGLETGCKAASDALDNLPKM
jgi:hypothetical protein